MKLFCLPVLAGAGLLFFLAGCHSPYSAQPLATQSGLPEVVLPSKPLDQIKAVAGDFFRQRGYVQSDAASRHNYEMVFDKPVQDSRAGKALRIRLRLHKQTDGSWRLVGTPCGVESWRGDLESEQVLLEGASQIQGFLLEIKGRLEMIP